MPRLTSETLAGRTISFSDGAYAEAMRLYDIADIEAIAKQVEDSSKEKRGVPSFLRHFGVHIDTVEDVPAEVANFFRDFAIMQETDNPNFDIGCAIGSLATRIELALDQVPASDRTPEFYARYKSDREEYELAFS